MRIVIEITHPAHVHFFKNPIGILEKQGHEILVTSRDKDCALQLLDELNIPHQPLSKFGSGLIPMLAELGKRNLLLSKLLRKFNADVVTGVGGTCAAHAGRLAGCPSVIFYDTEEARLQNFITYPFATKVVVPECYTGWTPARKTVRYHGYHELSYLHPNYFKPDYKTALENGLASEGNTFLIRLVSWKANHDLGLRGWSVETLSSVVEHLSASGRVLISSEAPLPSELAPYAYKGHQNAIHHVMAHCCLVVGESATMASEAVVIGVPAIYAAPSYRGYISEQQGRYGLASYLPEPSSDTIISQIDELLTVPDWDLKERHAMMMSECINVAEFIADTLFQAGS